MPRGTAAPPRGPTRETTGRQADRPSPGTTSEFGATFNSPAPAGSIPIVGGIYTYGVITNADGYSFSGSPSSLLETLGGGITANGNTTINCPILIADRQTWNVASGKSLTVGAVHTFFNDLTIGGGGSVYVAGAVDGGSSALTTNAPAPGKITYSGAGNLNFSGDGAVSVDLAKTSTGGLYISPAAGQIKTWSGAITGSGTGAIHKTDQGTLILTARNTYSATTYIDGGVLQANIGTGIPSSRFLVLNGGVLQSDGGGAVNFTRSLGTSGSRFQWSGSGGGFSAGAGALTVNVGNSGTPITLTWGNTPGTNIVGTLKFGSTTSQNVTTFRNPVNLYGADRTINVDDNPASAADYTVMQGAITTSIGTAGLIKTGNGLLGLAASNSYNGGTTISGGAVSMMATGALGSGAVSVASGASCDLATSTTMTFSNAITLNGLGGTVGGLTRPALYGDGSGGVYTLSGQITLAASSDVGNSTNNGMLTLSGRITGPGGLVIENTIAALTDQAGPITLSGANSNDYGGSTTINRGTVYLQKSGGAVAIPGDVTISAGGSTSPGWNTYLILKESNQIASSAVMSFYDNRTCYSYFELLGNQQTLAGISDFYARGIIENAEQETGINNTGTLTIDNTADCAY